LIDTYLSDAWEIKDIFFPWVEKRVRDDGVLVSAWGRRLDLRYRRIDNDLYREAYSFYMQAGCADWTNQFLFLPTHYYMICRYGKPCNGQVHDEVIVSVPIMESYDVARFMVDSAEQTMMIPSATGGRNPLCVPADITIGRNWGDKRGCEFKRLPERDDFYQALVEKGFFEGQ
jgi:DNA polymerase I-like protein with 3'-5' exonuclease and polymerase domains